MRTGRYIYFLWGMLLLQSTLTNAFAQTKHSKDSIQAKQYGDVCVSVSSGWAMVENTNNIRISLVTGKDTLQANSEATGTWFYKVPAGLARVFAEADGFITDSDTVRVYPGKVSNKRLYLTERVLHLQTVKVEGNIPALVYRGDTIRFNPKGVNVLEDDMVRQILEQMPGVTITDNSVEVMGKRVERTYVDGKLIFGDNPMTAIDHMQGTDVVNIYAYDEDEHKEQSKKNRKGRRRRVLNIETFSKMVNSQDGNLMAGAGTNLNSHTLSDHDLRYVAGGYFNFFSEQLMLSLDGSLNNLNKTTNMPMHYSNFQHNPTEIYIESGLGALKFSRKWEKKPGFFKEIRSSYQFIHTDREQNRLTEQDYFATEDFQERSFSNQSQAARRENRHEAQLGWNMNDEKWGKLTVDYTFQTNHNGTDNTQHSTNRTDGRVSELNQRTGAKEQLKSHIANLSWNVHFGDWKYGLKANYANRQEEETEQRSNQTDGLQEEITLSMEGNGNRWSVKNSLSYLPSKNNSTNVFLSYNIDSDHSRKQRLAWNTLTEEVDPLNTYSYRSREIVHTPEVGLQLNLKKLFLDFTVGWKQATSRDDRIGGSDRRSKDFNGWVGRLNIINTGMKKIGFDLVYTLDLQLPNVVQWRPELDNSNLYFLSSGNPNLKASPTHQLQLNENFKLNKYGHSLRFTQTIGYTRHPIGNRTLYFAEETYLPDYDYTVLAGSSLSTFDNMNEAWKLNLRMAWELPLTKIKSKLSVTPSFDFSRTPYYYNEVRDVSYVQGWSVITSFNFNKIKKLRALLSGRVSHNRIKTALSGREEWHMGNHASLNITYKPFWKYFSAGMFYRLEHRKFSGERPSVVRNILNLQVSAKLFNRRGELTLMAYDVLRSKADQRITIQDNFISYAETEDYGKYVTLNFSWTFRKVKSNRMDVSRGMQW